MLEIIPVISERIRNPPASRLPLVHVLNLRDANLCEKRGERVRLPDGSVRQACADCVTGEFKGGKRMGVEDVLQIFNYFVEDHGTGVITVNGVGDPFHPVLKELTFWKILFAANFDMRTYVFTAGQNLDAETCSILASQGVNVMISHYGNTFIDASFFEGRQYPESEPPFQNQAEIARNIRRLLATYRSTIAISRYAIPIPLADDRTRIGMNYIVSDEDLKDGGAKLRALKEAAEANGIFFVCNTDFKLDPNSEKYRVLKALARENSTFNREHTTADERGQCLMGAGAAVTIDYDGTMLRCPYMPSGKGDGNFLEMDDAARERVIATYLADTGYACTLRRTSLRD